MSTRGGESSIGVVSGSFLAGHSPPLPPSIVGGVRQTHLNLAHRCMRQLWFYLYRGPMKPNYSRLVGISGHQAIEYGFNHKLKHEENPRLSAMVEVFATNFDQGLPDCEKDDTDPGRLKDKVAQETLPLFHQQEVEHLEPKLVEEHFTLELNESPVPIVGTIDLFTKKGELADWKFRPGKRLPTQRETERSFQLATYAFALKARGEKVREAVEYQLACNPDHPARVVPQRTEPGTIPENSILDEYVGIVRFVERAQGDPENYPMTDPRNWWCDRRWCGWAAMCPRFGGNHG